MTITLSIPPEFTLIGLRRNTFYLIKKTSYKQAPKRGFFIAYRLRKQGKVT